MPVSPFRYPSCPTNVDTDAIKPSETFRKEAVGVVKEIIAFILTYLALIVAAIALAAFCAWLGFWVISFIKNLWTLLFGIGLMGLGVMVLYFLFKFVFQSNTVDRSAMIEITAKDQPMLFQFIKRLAKETQTPLPKKIYVSPEVNAMVFYDSSFWSMFLPVRKNLNIGLGLVNAVNVSEFKAILAHELGHFSQKSMKLGSYVYNVNRIIHDMLFDNDDYNRSLEGWANAGQYFYAFAELTSSIVRIIQEVLTKSYRSINERYMALSREMEFHADAVAASVSGSSPLITALYRVDVAHMCYQNVLAHHARWIKGNRKAVNVYEHHTTAMKSFADVHQLTVDENNQIQVSAKAFSKYHWNRVVIKDQWASHPSITDREKYLTGLNIKSDIVADPAWALFVDPDKLQKELTEQLYAEVKFNGKPELIDNSTFRYMLQDDLNKYRFNPEYCGFYDNRKTTIFDVDDAIQQPHGVKELPEILTEKTLSLPFLIQGLDIDIQTLKMLQAKFSPVKTFDFEGRKHDRSEASALILKLIHERDDAAHSLARADKDLFLLFYHKSAQKGNGKTAVTMYNELFSWVKKTEDDLNLVNSMLQEASQLFKDSVTQGMAMAVTNNMKRKGEEIKNAIKQMLEDENYTAYYSDDDKKTLLMFIDDNRKYFFNVGLDYEAVMLFMKALETFGRIISDRSFNLKKYTLDIQLKVIQS